MKVGARISSLRAGVALVLILTSSLTSAVARAQPTAPPTAPASPPSAEAKAAARESFDRGLKLFNDGENAGALAEFERAYALVPNPLVLYNIGLVHAAMGRSVQAVDALDRVLAAPGPVTGDTLARAQQVRAEQAQRIAEVVVTTSAPAAIDVDGVLAGQAPLGAPLRLTSGVHVIGASASGYTPQKKEMTIAGGDHKTVHFDLELLQARITDLTVKSRVPHADVIVDGKNLGTTPLVDALRLPIGNHSIEIHRDGYTTVRRDLTLTAETASEVSLDPEEDPAAVAARGGAITLEISQAEAIIVVDGQPRMGATTRLPPGLHTLVVTRGGFETYTREISVDSGMTTQLRVELDPTPETRAGYEGHAKAQRLWGIVATSVGVALAGTGVVVLVANAGPRSNAQSRYDTAQNNVALGQTGQSPDVTCNVHTKDGKPLVCNQTQASAKSNLDDAKQVDVYGWVGVGAGSAIALVGAYILFTGDDPHRYDRLGTAKGASLTPFAAPTANGGIAGLRGSF